MLEIKDLHAGFDGNEIIKGISLSVQKGEIHAVMGPNGSGKSTMAKILSGHPAYEAMSGEIIFDGKNLLEMEIGRAQSNSSHTVISYAVFCLKKKKQ